ncbi:hypothetical protein LguiA_030326 [Lonicera macranthoides]
MWMVLISDADLDHRQHQWHLDLSCLSDFVILIFRFAIVTARCHRFWLGALLDGCGMVTFGAYLFGRRWKVGEAMGKKEESRWIEIGADVETRVEEAGPWTFDNRPLIVKPWTDDANLEREDMVEVPVWVRERLAYARLCVEVKMDATRLEMVLLQDENAVVIKKQDTDSGTGREEEGISITGTRGSPQHVHGDTTKGNTSVVSVADKQCSNASSNAMNEGIDGSKGFEALEYIDEGEVHCPKAPDKGHKKKNKGSPNGGGGRAKNSKRKYLPVEERPDVEMTGVEKRLYVEDERRGELARDGEGTASRRCARE